MDQEENDLENLDQEEAALRNEAMQIDPPRAEDKTLLDDVNTGKQAAGDVEQAEAEGLGARSGQLVGQGGGLHQGEQVEGQDVEPPPGCMGAGAPSARSDCRAGRRRPSRSS